MKDSVISNVPQDIWRHWTEFFNLVADRKSYLSKCLFIKTFLSFYGGGPEEHDRFVSSNRRAHKKIRGPVSSHDPSSADTRRWLEKSQPHELYRCAGFQRVARGENRRCCRSGADCRPFSEKQDGRRYQMIVLSRCSFCRRSEPGRKTGFK